MTYPTTIAAGDLEAGDTIVRSHYRGSPDVLVSSVVVQSFDNGAVMITAEGETEYGTPRRLAYGHTEQIVVRR